MFRSFQDVARPKECSPHKFFFLIFRRRCRCYCLTAGRRIDEGVFIYFSSSSLFSIFFCFWLFITSSFTDDVTGTTGMHKWRKRERERERRKKHCQLKFNFPLIRLFFFLVFIPTHFPPLFVKGLFYRSRRTKQKNCKQTNERKTMAQNK